MRESYTWWLKKLRKADWSLPDKDSMSNWGSNKSSLHLCDNDSPSPARCDFANSCSGSYDGDCDPCYVWAQSSYVWYLSSGYWYSPGSYYSSYAFSVRCVGKFRKLSSRETLLFSSKYFSEVILFKILVVAFQGNWVV